MRKINKLIRKVLEVSVMTHRKFFDLILLIVNSIYFVSCRQEIKIAVLTYTICYGNFSFNSSKMGSESGLGLDFTLKD